MKAFYAIFFLVCFVLATDAQSDYFGSTAKESLFFVSDSTIGAFEDSVAITEKDSIKSLPDLDIVSKARFGMASFYSRNLEGTKTATGETFRHDYLTAASNNYKLNAWVRVTNLSNGKDVIVRINDRMHPSMAKKGRLVDLTIAAAKEIGLSSKKGITKVKVEEIAVVTAGN
ncbi:MAG TPA: septal ring lytic transglycosylase RlpA family protein [Panacibacter sp.]|nr:septal ring lytic transglycosylase RlpA family protein [Panacibacter sp.]HNP45848.1 septal ring lytic transglycosylase RlpA family protein [Panacibacter sp.]